MRFETTEQDEGERADVVVARRAAVPRSAARDALRDGAVTVAGKRVRPSHRVARGDLVQGEVTVPVQRPPTPEDIPVDVVFSDDRVLVVSKPAGLVTHPARGHPAGTLVNALLALGGPLARAGSKRPGIVHRLDAGTSGLLLAAKDDDALASLKDALRHRKVERRYLALVRGSMPAPSGTVEAPLGRHPVRRRLVTVLPEGKPAVTHYRVVSSSGEATLLEAFLDTGRTHQIRVHMSHLGHPVVGDRTYGGAGELAARLGLARPFLHAWRLAFPHPEDGRRVELADPLPGDLVEALRRAGLAPPPG